MRNNIFDIKGMSCSACSARVQDVVNKLEGVEKADVNLLTNSMSVSYNEAVINELDIINAVKSSGYDAQLKQETSTEAKQKVLDKSAKKLMTRLVVSSVFLLLLMIVAMGHMIGINIIPHHMQILKGIIEIILLVPIVVLNFKYFTSGFKALVRLNPNMDSLIAVGATASVVYSIYQLIKGGSDHYYFESAGMILTFITIGKYLESKSKAKTTSAVTKLMDLSPKTSIVLVDGVETEIESKDIKQDDIVIVKSGMTFPADGVVISGNGTADEAAITGESIPVGKKIGDNVTGGTLLVSGYVQFRALKVGEETTLAGIIRLVEEATITKPKIARLADKISRVFVPVVILIAVVTTLVWYLVSKDFELSLVFGISVLVISCPCALGLATPTAIMVGTGKAAELGILVKSAEIFEAGGKVKTVMLDKTGTITTGKPKVTDVVTESEDEIKLMAICASIESMSDHPLAQAVVEYTENYIPASVENFENVTGKGVRAYVSGAEYRIGNRTFAAQDGLSYSLSSAAEKLSSEGKTALYIRENDKVLGVIGIADTVKDSSREAVELLNKSGIDTVMLTGDNKKTAESIMNQVGIKKINAELMPAEKNEIIRQYQLEGAAAMVGDGINDSPALAAADVGIALGAGTDIAMESADVVLIRNDLRDVHTTLHICRKVMKNIKENLFWALIYNAIGIPIAAGVLYPAFGIQLSPMIGTIAMSLSSICVISNALRLKRLKRGYDTEAGKEKKEMKTVYIEGMACGHCSARVAELLRPLDANVVVDHVAGTAVIASGADDNAIKTAVESGGYKVVKID
ncbi:MAG: heavy metal translocating P-type ATPase [Clostridia bacterium]|nr:heavy metal translocating P-type ATPase [Clostridia bacterium]